jgi:hypothetical protein
MTYQVSPAKTLCAGCGFAMDDVVQEGGGYIDVRTLMPAPPRVNVTPTSGGVHRRVKLGPQQRNSIFALCRACSERMARDDEFSRSVVQHCQTIAAAPGSTK